MDVSQFNYQQLVTIFDLSNLKYSNISIVAYAGKQNHNTLASILNFWRWTAAHWIGNIVPCNSNVDFRVEIYREFRFYPEFLGLALAPLECVSQDSQ